MARSAHIPQDALEDPIELILSFQPPTIRCTGHVQFTGVGIRFSVVHVIHERQSLWASHFSQLIVSFSSVVRILDRSGWLVSGLKNHIGFPRSAVEITTHPPQQFAQGGDTIGASGNAQLVDFSSSSSQAISTSTRSVGLLPVKATSSSSSDVTFSNLYGPLLT